MFGLFSRKRAKLSDDYLSIRTAIDHNRATQRDMLIEACRTLPAKNKLDALYSEALTSPDMTAELAAHYGQQLTRLSWAIERGEQP